MMPTGVACGKEGTWGVDPDPRVVVTVSSISHFLPLCIVDASLETSRHKESGYHYGALKTTRLG